MDSCVRSAPTVRRGHRRHRCDIRAPAHTGPHPDRWHRLRVRDDCESASWPVAPYDVFRRELTIKGSFAQQFSFDRALAYLRSGRVDTTEW
jgi:threonine dehydrogenase-like Zn-dependent dehydrogenase